MFQSLCGTLSVEVLCGIHFRWTLSYLLRDRDRTLGSQTSPCGVSDLPLLHPWELYGVTFLLTQFLISTLKLL